MLYVLAPVVTDHHFISHHERLHEALGADGAPLTVGTLAVVAGDRWRRGELAWCAAFNEVCGQEGRLS